MHGRDAASFSRLNRYRKLKAGIESRAKVPCCKRSEGAAVAVFSERSAFLKDKTYKKWNPHDDVTGVLDVENSAKMCTGNAVQVHQDKLIAKGKPVGWDVVTNPKNGNVTLSRGTNWK
jgi:hypothetical protein